MKQNGYQIVCEQIVKEFYMPRSPDDAYRMSTMFKNLSNKAKSDYDRFEKLSIWYANKAEELKKNPETTPKQPAQTPVPVAAPKTSEVPVQQPVSA